jgi:hypothetical protein
MKTKTNRITEINHNYTNHVVKNLNSIHSQIYDYNDKLWSKFLVWIWLLFGTNISFVLYMTIFGNLNLILKLIISCCLAIIIFCFLFLINTVSSLTYSVNINLKYLISLFATNAFKKIYISPQKS